MKKVNNIQYSVFSIQYRVLYIPENYMQARLVSSHLMSSNLFLRIRVVLLRLLRGLLLQIVDVFASVGVLLQPELLGLRERTDVCGRGGAEGDRANDAGGEKHDVWL